MSDDSPGTHWYIWRVKTSYPEQFGKRCRIVSKPTWETVEVEFQNGERTTVRRSFVRRDWGEG